jgi:hypothetical protein
MWIDRNLPYGWDAIRDSGWILCLIHISEATLPVERIRRTYPQVYPQDKPVLI